MKQQLSVLLLALLLTTNGLALAQPADDVYRTKQELLELQQAENQELVNTEDQEPEEELTEADVAHLRTRVITADGTEMWQSVTGEMIPIAFPIKKTVAELVYESKLAAEKAAELERQQLQQQRIEERIANTSEPPATVEEPEPVELEPDPVQEEFKQAIRSTLGQAVSTHKKGYSLQRDLRVAARISEQLSRQYIALQSRRRQEENLLKKLEEEINAYESKNNIDIQTVPEARGHLERQKQTLADFVRYMYLQESITKNVGPSDVPRGVQLALQGELGSVVEQAMYNRAMHRVREELLYHVEGLQDRPVLLDIRKKNVRSINEQIASMQPEYVKSHEEVITLKSRVFQMADTAARIQQEVLQMQREMIAYQKKHNLTGDTLETEIANSQQASGPDASLFKELAADIFLFNDSLDFTWPVYGIVSAEFRSLAYQKLFGLPHNALDIAVPQGTSVYAAADGIVYTVHDGGQHGYSYMLIGHGNYATLYGHLFEMLAPPGTIVKKGDVIAKSGGTPGTWGAGQMTTGAHLHFEMFKDGEHINPRLLLPNLHASAG
jgi:murein DD-endopeptidase MepM/ murein hydrolase activator NlpD